MALGCEVGFYMWEGKCLAICPNASYPMNHTELKGLLSGVCVPCHYSCLYCNGPSDSQCTSCYPDSQLKTISIPGIIEQTIVEIHLTISCFIVTGSQAVPESHCYPHELVKQLTGYEHWSVGVELALAFNLALVVALMIYMMCTKKSCSPSCVLNCCSSSGERETNNRQGDYNLLTQTSGSNFPQPIGSQTIHSKRPSSKANIETEGV